MDQVVVTDILKAIKSDDLVLFSTLIKGKSNLSLGRFPLLSLCYLYNAKKIIKKFFKKLSQIKNYNSVSEPFEVYLTFKKFAGRTLRLYVKDRAIVSPIEMLAILHKDSKVSKTYKIFAKNETIMKNLVAIYSIWGQKINITESKIKISLPKLSRKEKFITRLALVVSVFFVLTFAGGYALSIFKVGIGSEKYPFMISSESRFYQALESGEGYFKLSKDIVINSPKADVVLKGNIDGNNHTIFINTVGESLISKNTGSIKNLNIKYPSIDSELSDSLSLFVDENNGVINGVSISCDELKLTFNKSQEKDIFFGAIAITNNGLIDNCKVSLNAEILGQGDGECSIGGIVGINNSEIKNSIFEEGSISTTVADVAGIVALNSGMGTIDNCVNNARISQSSGVNGWSPNASGVCLTNNGTLKNSYNNGTIFVNSTTEGESVMGNVFASGITAMNYGIVDKCLNKGEIKATSKQMLVYAGGIVANSDYTVVGGITTLSLVSGCGNISNISISTEHENAYVFAGGISGYMYGAMTDCYSITTFTNGFSEEKYFMGLSLGSSQLYSIFQPVICINASNNYVASQDNVAKHIGAVILSNTIYQVGIDCEDEIIATKSEEEIKQLEIYWNE